VALGLEENEREEWERSAARVADLAVKLRRLILFTVSGLSFFIYALGVLSAAILFEGLGLGMGLGSLIGMIVSAITYYWVEKKLFEVIQLEKEESRIGVALAITGSIVVGIVHALLLPEKAYLSWYPALAVFLVGIGIAAYRSEYTLPHFLVGLFLLVTTPLVDYTNGYVGAGLVGLAYFVAGAYSLVKGLK
jgi:hypothetical protein